MNNVWTASCDAMRYGPSWVPRVIDVRVLL